MDEENKRQLAEELRRLDLALARNDGISANLARLRVNELLAQGAAPQSDKPQLPAALPGWMRQIVEDRGVRVPALERALGVHRAVISPTFGKQGVGVQIQFRF